MNDDIVTQLRMSADLIDGFPKALAKNVFPTSWLSEAADEIERLQADRDRWRTIAKGLARWLMNNDNDEDLKGKLALALDYDEAVRGE